MSNHIWVIVFPEGAPPTQSQRQNVYYRSTGDSPLPQPETNVSFIGRFQTSSLQQPPSRFTSTEGGIVQETNTNFIGKFLYPPYKVSLYQGADTEIPPPPSQPIAQSFVIVFPEGQSPSASQRHLFYSQPPHEVPLVAQPETNTNFIGKYTAPSLHRNVNLFAPEAEGGIVHETNTNFVGKYSAPPYKVSLYAGFTEDQSFVGPVADTTPNFIGRYAAPPYKVSLYAGAPTDIAPPASQPIAQSFVIVFPEGQSPSAAQRNLFYFQPPHEVPSTSFETNPHFIGRYTAPPYKVSLYHGGADSQPLPPQTEASNNFIGRYQAPPYKVSLYASTPSDQPVPTLHGNQHLVVITYPEEELPSDFQRILFYQNIGNDVPAVVQPETNPHFVGKFKADPYRVSLYPSTPEEPAVSVLNTDSDLFVIAFPESETPTAAQRALFYQWQSPDGVVILQPPTEKSFIGKYNAPPYKVSLYAGVAEDAPPLAPQPETNINFVGRYTAPPYKVSLYAGVAEDALPVSPYQPVAQATVMVFPEGQSPSAAQRNLFYSGRAADPFVVTTQPETNPPFIGRYRSDPYRVSLYAGFNDDIYTNPIGSETNIQVIAFPQEEMPTAAQRRFYQSTAQDPPVQETNPHFIGRYRADPYRVSLYQGIETTAPIPPQPETNTNFIGKFNSGGLQRFFGLRNPPLEDPPVQETNPHFVGRYTAPPYKVSLYQGIETTAPTPPQPETNTNFIARFNTGGLQRFTGLLNPPHDDPPVPETNVSFIGKYHAEPYRVTLYAGTETDTPPPAPPQSQPIAQSFVIVYPEGQSPSIAQRNLLYFQSPHEIPVVSVETNISFIGKYRAEPYRVTLYAGIVEDVSVPQPETNVNFIGRFSAPPYKNRLYPHDSVELLPHQAETNVSFIGKFRPDHLARRMGDVANVPLDIIIPDDPIYFKNRFSPGKLDSSSRIFFGSDWIIPPPPPISRSGYVLASDSALAYVVAFDGIPGP